MAQTDLPIVHRRARWLHWLAWAAAVAAIVVLAFAAFGEPGRETAMALGWTDLGLTLAFAVEIFTRSGWRRDGWKYLAWRWFDFIAMVPLVFLFPLRLDSILIWVWIVLVMRLVRLVDRTLGDGFVQRNALALLSAVEEEISDRVLLSIIARIETEIALAKFGEGAANALGRNREAVLNRIYEEQLRDGAFSKIATFTGLRETIERAEEKTFDAIRSIVGSKETDEAIRDVIQTALRRARLQIGAKSWKRRLGLRKEAAP